MDIEGGMRVKDISIEEIKSMPQVDLTKGNTYEVTHNEPEDMEKVLGLWSERDIREREVDRELYYLFINGVMDDLMPGTFNPDFKEPPYENLHSMEFGEVFFNEIMRMEFREMFDEKINSDIREFRHGNLLYQGLEGKFDISIIEEYARDNNYDLEEYSRDLKKIDNIMEETFYDTLNYLHYELKYTRGEDVNLDKLLESEDSVADMIGETIFLIASMFQSNPELRDCMEMQLKSLSYMTEYSQTFSSESVRRIRFWKDFISYGYSKEKAQKELNFRKGGLY